MATRLTTQVPRYEITPLGPDVSFGAIVNGLTLAHLDDLTMRRRLFDL